MSQRHPGTGLADTRPEVGRDTVEAVVRHQLAEALGGKRGMVEAAVPTIGFTVTYLFTKPDFQPALMVGIGAAVVLLVARVVQRSSPKFVINAFVGILIAAVFAARSGKAEDAFLPGIFYNAGYAVVMVFTILIRWPIVGLMLGSVTGDPSAWRSNPAVVRLCGRLTGILVLPCLIRVAVQLPLYLAGQVFALGVTKVILGWPLQVAALAAMAGVLARGHTPLAGEDDAALRHSRGHSRGHSRADAPHDDVR